MTRVLLYFFLLFAVTAYAFRRGGPDERAATAVCLGASLASLLIMAQAGADYRSLQPLVALIDALVLGAFIWIALRSERFWPLWVAGFQLTATSGHFLKYIHPGLISLAYSASLAFWSYLILFVVAGGTWRSSRRRMLLVHAPA